MDKKIIYALVLKETYYFLRFMLNNKKISNEKLVALTNEKNNDKIL